MTALIFRALWAIFLAVILSYGLRRSWKIEHGKTEKLIGDTNEAVVWMTPLVFPLLIAIFFLIDLIFDGIKGGLDRFMVLALDVFISMSVYFIFLLFLLPVLRKYFSARACATLWLVPVLLFYQPGILAQSAYVPMYTLYIPGNVLQIFIYVWLAGSVILFAGEILSGFTFRRRLLRGARRIEDARLLELWEEEKKKLRYNKTVRLLVCPDITTPLSMGMFEKSQATLLPEHSYEEDELRLIFQHELHHIQRRDVDTKVFLSFCRAMCWFNPLVWIAVRKASDDLELSCDEIVLENSGYQQRRQYAELLLRTAGNSRGFTTCLSSAAGSLRYRLKSVVQPRKRRAGILLLAVMMFACCMSYGSFAIASDRGEVGELVLANVSAENVCVFSYYDTQEGGEIYTSTVCSDELLSYLEGLKADKFLGSGSWTYKEEGPELYCEVMTEAGLLYLSFNGRILSVENSDKNQSNYYKLRSPMDYEYIWGFFEQR